MSIRPVDMQIVLPKTTEYANERQGDINKQMSDQNVFHKEVEKQTETRQTVVVKSNESNEMDKGINKDGRNRQGDRGRRRKKREQDENEPEKKYAGLGLFDVRI